MLPKAETPEGLRRRVISSFQDTEPVGERLSAADRITEFTPDGFPRPPQRQTVSPELCRSSVHDFRGRAAWARVPRRGPSCYRSVVASPCSTACPERAIRTWARRLLKEKSARCPVRSGLRSGRSAGRAQEGAAAPLPPRRRSRWALALRLRRPHRSLRHLIRGRSRPLPAPAPPRERVTPPVPGRSWSPHPLSTWQAVRTAPSSCRRPVARSLGWRGPRGPYG